MVFTTLVLLAGLTLLILGGDFLVRGASGIALRAKISALVVGLTVVAFGTSAPELLVCIQSALAGNPDIAMGNVIGSNICNLALVLGVTSVILPIEVHADSLKIDWPVTMGASLLLFVFILDGWVDNWEGLLFISLLAVYTVLIIRKSRKETKASLARQEFISDIPETGGHPAKDVLFLVLGAVGLYFGSEWFVESASTLAVHLGVTQRVISITVVALGTSLPELVTAAVASFKKESDLAVGNLLGSNIFNILSILGITSLVKEIAVNEMMLDVDMLWMLGITAIVLPMMWIKRRISRIEGAVLLGMYCFYTYTVIT